MAGYVFKDREATQVYLTTGRTELFDQVKSGLVTRPVKIGAKSVWPEHELEALNRARAANWSESQRRDLVRALEEARRLDVTPSELARLVIEGERGESRVDAVTPVALPQPKKPHTSAQRAAAPTA